MRAAVARGRNRPLGRQCSARACKPVVGGWLPIEVGFGLTERGWAGAEAGMACEAGSGAGARRDHGDRGRVSRAWRGDGPSRNTVYLGMRQADAVGRVFRDWLRWLVLLRAFRLASV